MSIIALAAVAAPAMILAATAIPAAPSISTDTSPSAAVPASQMAAQTAAPSPGFRPGLLLQTWVSGYDGAASPHSALRLRRLELQAKGEVLGGMLRYGAMAEFGQALEQVPLDGSAFGGSGTLLKPNLNPAALIKDLHVTVRTAIADVQVGQAKIPVSLDGITSSSTLLLPERAAAALEFGYKRDLGIQVIRGFGPVKATAGLFARQTIADLAAAAGTSALPRDAALRVDIKPWDSLLVGAVAYGTVAGRGMAGARDRGELDVRWEPGPYVLQGELIGGADIDSNGVRRRALGTYVTAGYQLTPQVQPVVRLGYLDKDLDRVVGTLKPVTQLDLGLNLATPIAGTRVQAGYSLTWSGAGSPAQGATVAGQYRF